MGQAKEKIARLTKATPSRARSAQPRDFENDAETGTLSVAYDPQLDRVTAPRPRVVPDAERVSD